MNEEKTLEVIDIPDEVIISRAEYDELLKARFGIDMIGWSFGKYGPNDTVVYSVCAQFGYVSKEDNPNA